MILVALDLFGLDVAVAQSIRQAVVEATAIPEELVFIACTNTHSGPAAASLVCWRDVPAPDAAYIERVRRSAVGAASEAAATTEPVGIAWRRLTHGVDGLDEREIGLLAVRRTEGPFAAFVVIDSLSPVCLGPASASCSADFPGKVRVRLHERLGEKCVVLHFGAPHAESVCSDSVLPGGVGAVEHIGVALADAIADEAEGLGFDAFAQDVQVGGKRVSVDLPRRVLPELWAAEMCVSVKRAEYERAAGEGGSDADALRIALREVLEAEGMFNLARAQENGSLDVILRCSQPVDVQAVRIGDGCLAGLPGLLAFAYGRQLRERAPVSTFPVGLVNGMVQGCIVTPEDEEAGRFGVACGPFSAEAGSLMVLQSLQLLDALAH